MSNTNQYIENRAKKLGFNNSLSFLKNCSPDFDIHKSIETHKQTKSIIEYDDFQQYIETDDEIHELVCLLNKSRPTTSMSCQYDMYGYANISFTMTGFTFFTNILLKHAKLFISTKYPSLSNEEVSELVLNLADEDLAESFSDFQKLKNKLEKYKDNYVAGHIIDFLDDSLHQMNNFLKI